MIAPSILSANFLHLNEAVDMVEKSEADWYHIDVMDGHFVPNISFGFPIIKALGNVVKKPMDIHLMISNPDQYVERFAAFHPKVISVHFEACMHLHRTLQSIKSFGIMGGLAVNPHTSISSISEILERVDLVCLMGVNPGFGGQKFILETLRKIKQLTAIREERNLNFLIEIDGGVDENNSASLFKAGADVLVAGSAVFKSPNPLKTIEKLKNNKSTS
ncbi:MAG: Ribulose-phosphate 3-epimerase [Bacteroidetes bacterium MED-G17]|nr:MAG: ribulose-phosphate 3-epimerase [Bacteroidetes bacterium TMED39]CAI8345022.1 MAG: Ribulose-phosphate 3-epimerase [Bacteroidetes bacterium MED-G17]|tara:strand:+ start:469 stop:1122 length:654 start_codon:yes stop_codon:yes gene_type:complete